MQESIVITHKELMEETNNDLKKIYIAVHSHDGAAYKLKIHFSDKIQIKLGTLESGIVKLNEIVNYQLKEKIKIGANISIDLQAVYGNPDVFLKSCSDDKCEIT